jgi:hypothetical protein
MLLPERLMIWSRGSPALLLLLAEDEPLDRVGEPLVLV